MSSVRTHAIIIECWFDIVVAVCRQLVFCMYGNIFPDVSGKKRSKENNATENKNLKKNNRKFIAATFRDEDYLFVPTTYFITI
jgi:hypothetical protein